MSIAEKDYACIWHPYTHQKNRTQAIPIIKGKRALLYNENNHTYIDGVSSWWVTIHGHSNKYIAKKIYKQAKTLEHVIFAGFTHKPAVLLAEKLLPLLPGHFSKIFYSDNGSTATEVAIKMSLQFWVNKGETQRTKILALHHSYHGDTFGAMSVSERGTFTMAFSDKLFEVMFIDTPDENNITQIKNYITKCSNEIACFIYEPLLQGAGGMIMYDATSLDALLAFVKKEKIICIADEVLTGFYRTGKFFSGDYLREKADIICLSKGLTGGTLALGITACKKNIYEAFVSDDKTKTFFHGHSFTANPLACTAALASLELLLKEKFLKKIGVLAGRQRLHKKELKLFETKNIIKNLRQLGTIVAFEIVTGEQDNYLQSIGMDFVKFCLKSGVYLRAMGNTVYTMPPYCITKTELKKVYSVIKKFLKVLKPKS